MLAAGLAAVQDMECYALSAADMAKQEVSSARPPFAILASVNDNQRLTKSRAQESAGELKTACSYQLHQFREAL
jgi:hypothetical protein